jgi:hypothetical protein
MNATLGALLIPVILEVWNSVVYPELQKLETKIGSEDLKLVAQTFTDALNKIVQIEAPKI